MGIGRKIKQRREALKLTQSELSKLVGVTPSAITNYEADLSHPKEQVLYKLFEALDCDANYLFEDALNETEIPPLLSAEESELIDIYRDLSNTGKKMLLEHATMMTASGMYKKTPVIIAARNGKPPKDVPENPDALPDAPDTI